MLEPLLELGDTEHSSDWDPYLRIIFTDGTNIETESGYPYAELNEDKTKVTFYIGLSSTGNDPLKQTFDINTISVIQLRG